MHRLARKLGALAAIAAVALLAMPSQAQTGLPPELLASVRSAVKASRELTAREVAIAQSLGNPQLTATALRKARRRADAALTSTVVAIIASNVALADAVVEAAAAEAPDSRGSIMAGVAASFPFLAGRYATTPQTGLLPPPPAPVGRAAPPPAAAEPARPVKEEIVDPLEQVNRGIFFFNTTLDTLVLRPVAVIYGFIMPELVKRSVHNFFANLSTPVLLANDLLHLTFDDAAVTSGRFLINSTIGVLGLFEVAEDFGLEAHHADFGQTLYSYGLGQGLYVMLPVFGPSTARDAIGKAVDGLFQPANYLLDVDVLLALTGSEGVATRESLLVALENLREGSIDYYAAVRGAFYQDRATELRKGRADTAAMIDDLFSEID